MDQTKLRAAEMAKILKALAHPERIFIMEHLAIREHTVSELAEQLGRSAPTVSKHLSILRNAGLVQSRKDGLKAWYRTECKCISGFHTCVADLVQASIHRRRGML